MSKEQLERLRAEAHHWRMAYLAAETKLWELRGRKTEDGQPCLPPDDPGPWGEPGVPGAEP